jgi:cysteine-rich repeat protein
MHCKAALTVSILLLGACGAPGSSVQNTNNNNENDNRNAVCGNGEVEVGEACDDGANNSDAAPNACRTDCRLPHCGDGVIDDEEACDSEQLASNSCVGLGYTKGELACSNTCEYDVSGCSTCGDGTAEGTDTGAVGYEVCDGSDLRGQNCLSIGQAQGELACDSSCGWDISGCTGGGPICGNGIVEAFEECDDGNVDSCDGCSDTCQNEGCGNGTVECGEECDDAAANSDTTPDACRTDCTNPTCGDGTIDTGEECDGLPTGELCVDHGAGANGEMGCNMFCQLSYGYAASGATCYTCGAALCEYPMETPQNCPADCGMIVTCGNNSCDYYETASNCPQDCSTGPFCGDGTCDIGENNATCPQDCGSCGDGVCALSENSGSCPADCAATCGNLQCEPGLGETISVCPVDCGPACGNGVCDQGETVLGCIQDCMPLCGDNVCDPAWFETPLTCPQDCP